jgi:hypothetical protein
MTSLFKQTDKWFHFLGGIAAAVTVAVFFGAVPGLVAAIVVGLAKEIYDHFFRGTVDAVDFLATALGGVYVAVLFLVVKY